MATNANLDVNWDNDSVLTQNDAENKEVLIDDVNNKIYTIKDYIPRKITKRFLKPSYIILSVLILILVVIIGILSHQINDSVSRHNLSNTNVPINSTSLYESEHDIHDIHRDVDEKKSYSVSHEETTTIRADDTTYYSIITTEQETTTEEEILLSTYDPNEEENDLTNEIILCEENEIWLYDVNSQKLTLLYKSEHAIKTLEIASNKTLFMSEGNKIVSLNKKENQTEMNVDLIFEESRVNPKSMAIDTINDNLYIVDESMGGLIVINTQNKYYSLLVMDLKAPSSIALDSLKGIMFIGTSESILKGNMDGTSLQAIFNSTHIGTITLDKKRERIYWVQDFENIMSSNYSGLNQKRILEDHTSISELMVLGNRLFWLRVVEGMNTTLWSCSVKDDDYNDHSLHYTESPKNPKFIRGVGRLDSALKNENPSTRRKCDHLSLATPNGQVNCACNMGWQLVYNKSCQPYREFALYTLDNTIRARFLDTSRKYSLEYIWPTPFKVDSLTYKSSIDFDYDSKNDNFYFSDDSTIYQMKIRAKNYSNQKVIMTSPIRYIKYLVYDWYTGNIYYISRTKESSYDYYIGVLNSRSNIIKTNFIDPISCSKYYDYNDCIYGLAISPSYGYVFYTSKIDANTLHIHRHGFKIKNDNVFSDVVEIADMTVNYNDYTSWFALDLIKNRLYFISPYEGVINHINFNGTDRRKTSPFPPIMHKVQSASVHKQWIYINDGKIVWKMHKEINDFIKMMEIEDDRVDFGNFKIISQPEDNKNPCRNNNGGCEQFCYVGPILLCDCSENFTPVFNGTCIST